VIGLDCETYKIGARLTPRVVSIQLSHGAEASVHTREEFPEVIESVIAHLKSGGKIVGQNIAFDFGCLVAECDALLDPLFAAYANGQIFDTMIREQLIAIALGQFRSWRFSLDAIVQRRFGVNLAGKHGANVWRLRFSELDGRVAADWPRSAFEYARDDAKWVVKVYKAQSELHVLTDLGRPVVPLPDEKEQTFAAWCLHLLSIWGVKVDRFAADQWVRKIETAAEQHLDTAMAGGFLRENGTKNVKKIRELISIGYDGSPPLTDKGSIKTDRDTLLGSGNNHLVAYAKGSAVQKLASTYTKILRGVHSVHPRYNVLRRSGRTSCEKPNLQQAPRDGQGFRECFIPRAGYVFALCDYDQIELLALAQVLQWWCGTSALADAVREGRDLHIEVGARIASTTYDKLKERIENGDKKAKHFRQFAKVANYGFPGGLSSSGFSAYAQSRGVEITINEAADIRRAWLEAWPEMRSYFDKIGLACRSGNPITIAQEVSKRQRGGVSFTAACNTYFQGLVADGAKAALVEVSRRCYVERASALFNSRPVAFLHDEIIIETPAGESAAIAAEELAEVMISEMQKYIPDIPVSAAPVLAARWSKDAIAVHKDGKLQVWK